jgi:hypothetical protein
MMSEYIQGVRFPDEPTVTVALRVRPARAALPASSSRHCHGDSEFTPSYCGRLAGTGLTGRLQLEQTVATQAQAHSVALAGRSAGTRPLKFNLPADSEVTGTVPPTRSLSPLKSEPEP